MSRSLQLGTKRVLDALVAAAGIVLLLPVFVLIAIAIRLGSAGQVFFAQERTGLKGKRFRMLKFRTMVEDAQHTGSGLYVAKDDSRITRVGKTLRRFSLDELPQLFHILVGRMSLVGPRPALPYHVEHYTARQARRLLMRPGLTGWSQVNGRNFLSWPERLEKDAWYVDNFSLRLDARILIRTLAVLLSGEGLYGARDRFFFSGHDDIPAPSGRDS
ncbi:MAG TPA: sugar transferase [Candidatus Acidoferrum sp.]|nr:sugar transferase [Candidatus Acidoferrum sp.]